MNKIKSSGIQFLLGFGVISFLWIIGLLACDPFDWFLYVELDGIYQMLDIVLTVTPFLICLYLILLSVWGKRNNYKIMYYSALTAVCLPIVAYLFNELPLSDSSVLTWILNLTVGLVLYPFGVVSSYIFNDIDFGFGYYEGVYIAAILIVLVVFSIIAYKKTKSTD